MDSNNFDTQLSPSPEYRHFVYDPLGDGLVFFRSKAERDKFAEDAISLYLEDTWAEEVEQVVAGEVTHHAQCINKEHRPEKLDEEGCDEGGDYWGDPDWEWKGNYTLEPIEREAHEGNLRENREAKEGS